MDDIDMQKQIEERTAQAVERRIFKKAVYAVYHLGEGHRDIRRHTQGGRETRLMYRSPDSVAGLTIDFSRTVYDNSTQYEMLEILEGEEAVFLQRGRIIEGYIPGDWEAELDRLQRPADRAKEDMAKAAEQERHSSESERATALRKAWGLSAVDGRVRASGDPKPRIGGVVERSPRRRGA